MDKALTIDEFHALLSKRDGSDSPLMSLIGKLTQIEEPEDVTELLSLARVWSNWRSVEP